MALRDALRAGLIAQVPEIAVPREEIRLPPVLDPGPILAAVQGSWIEGIVIAALGTGMRLGELCGLRWEDIDGDVARVNGALRERGIRERRGGLRLVRQAPKTRSSSRAIFLPPEVLEAIGPRSTGYVFQYTEGEPFLPGSVSHAFRRLTGVRFHDLRHIAGTQLLAHGVSLPVVRDVLGHSSLAMASRYAHVVPSMSREASRVLSKVLSGAVGEPDPSTDRGSNPSVVAPKVAGSNPAGHPISRSPQTKKASRRRPS